MNYNIIVIVYIDAQIVSDLASGISFQLASVYFWYILIIISLCLVIYFFVSPVLCVSSHLLVFYFRLAGTLDIQAG